MPAACVTSCVFREQAGNPFPVWGTCLGFEWLMEYFGGNRALGRGFDSIDWPQPLTFTAQSPGRCVCLLLYDEVTCPAPRGRRMSRRDRAYLCTCACVRACVRACVGGWVCARSCE
eukprot:COSAG01_NODE_7280_length_3273_cov_5.446125_3_plen_116_part_00